MGRQRFKSYEDECNACENQDNCDQGRYEGDAGRVPEDDDDGNCLWWAPRIPDYIKRWQDKLNG